MLPAKHDRRHQDTDSPSMIGHTANADIFETIGKVERENNFERMMQIIGEAVEDNISQTRPDKQPQNCPYKIVLYGIVRIIVPFIFYSIDNEDVCDKKGNKVHETVIPKLKGSDLKNGRADMVRNMLPELYQSIHVHNVPQKTRAGTKKYDQYMFRFTSASGSLLDY